MVEVLHCSNDRRPSGSGLSAWSWNFSPDDVKGSRCSWRQILGCVFRSLAKQCGPLRNNVLGENLWIVGTCHACIEMNFCIFGLHTRANQFTSLLHRFARGLAPPRKWSKMIAAKQYSFGRKGHPLRRRMNKRSELSRCLPGVPAQLVHLTRSRLYVENRVILLGLLNGRIDHPRMRGTHGVDAAVSRDTIARDHILQVSARVALVRRNCLIEDRVVHRLFPFPSITRLECCG